MTEFNSSDLEKIAIAALSLIQLSASLDRLPGRIYGNSLWSRAGRLPPFPMPETGFRVNTEVCVEAYP